MRGSGVLILVLAVAATGCADDVVCPSASGFTLTAPAGFAELVPGGTVTVAWTADGTPGAAVSLEAIATDADTRIALPPANLGDHQLTWDGTRADGGAAPAGNYRIGGQVGAVGGCDGATVAPDDLHLIVVQGVRMPTAPITFVGSQLTRMVTVQTVTRSVIVVRYAVDPSAAVDGDELVFAQATVPGEFTPIARSYPFSGLTTDGAAIPDGDYELIALVGAPTGYRVVGPRLTWHPGQ